MFNFILRSTFAQPSLNLRSSFAEGSVENNWKNCEL